MKRVLSVLAILALSAQAACSSGPRANTSATVRQCHTVPECREDARLAGIATHIALPTDDHLRFANGTFYPKSTLNPQWGFRLKFAGTAGGRPTELDVHELPIFKCYATATEAGFLTAGGRSACFVQGSPDQVRYEFKGILYEVYLLRPLAGDGVLATRTLLGEVVDSLR